MSLGAICLNALSRQLPCHRMTPSKCLQGINLGRCKNVTNAWCLFSHCRLPLLRRVELSGLK
ncbi:hypothetical protein PAXRUDRAFT_654147 [Paxillus rubicundulus Ve08.2h10]|uniref:Uncharacterized protein n=1 Tax=Paxillus rubicundulus Ve08.2h10 TaxID=930991 RepID=A0A0D0EC37_9AGAM|nr:hypothetical protein PAXRUDRAFT_654147 [Paxillus rubicundulus Ve08.2h10]